MAAEPKKARRVRGPDYDPDATPQRPKPQRLGARTGRPTTFNEENMRVACAMAKMGATDIEITRELGIASSTLYMWMQAHPLFAEAVKAGKAAFDQRIERGLAQRAAGYAIETEKVFANGTRVKVIEHVPGDTTAMIFWLKNRDPANWRDRKELDITPPASSVEGPSIRQLAMAALALLAAAEYATGDEPAMIEAQANPQPEDDDDGFDSEDSFSIDP